MIGGGKGGVRDDASSNSEGVSNLVPLNTGPQKKSKRKGNTKRVDKKRKLRIAAKAQESSSENDSTDGGHQIEINVEDDEDEEEDEDEEDDSDFSEEDEEEEQLESSFMYKSGTDKVSKNTSDNNMLLAKKGIKKG